MRNIIIHNQKCYLLDDFLKKYDNHYEAQLGIREISPKDIISFSLTEKEILTSGKLNWLMEQIRINGWKPTGLGSFHLILLPNGKFSVYSGGNHRAYLSKQLKIEKVYACITVLINRNDISSTIKLKIDELKKNTDSLNKHVTYLNKKIRDAYPFQSMDEESKIVNKLFDNISSIEDDINTLLLNEALRLGYLTKELYFQEQ